MFDVSVTIIASYVVMSPPPFLREVVNRPPALCNCYFYPSKVIIFRLLILLSKHRFYIALIQSISLKGSNNFRPGQGTDDGQLSQTSVHPWDLNTN